VHRAAKVCQANPARLKIAAEMNQGLRRDDDSFGGIDRLAPSDMDKIRDQACR
jgi:hypothetical protein